ncbi:hypothetical protein HGRIS_003785 [Hohenbuehelia grisea]|uniref:Uncharacterized protein n=1 Tax=Hohenbuehelia grisea TaxID=104357 RepID=A0ABR3JGK3_9AGAR
MQAHLDTTNRPPSVRSVASTASRVSLSRQPRTRSRSKTVTEPQSRARNLSPDGSPASELAYLDKGLVDEPESASSPASPTMNVGSFAAAPEPIMALPALPGDSGSYQGVQEDDTVVVGEHGALKAVAEASKGVLEKKQQKAAIQAATLARINTKPPPSAFSRMPELVHGSGANARDSVLTQNSVATRMSTTSSSLYPPSTSTASASGTESPPSPRSLATQAENNEISSYDPDMEAEHEFDGDDVSYRLRLLVKNSYFLPPAHSKPSPSDLAPAVDIHKKASPTFMDLFRGKSKSKPSSPILSPDPQGPILRTTSDTITLSAYAARPPPRSAPVVPIISVQSHKPPDMAGRVVVVREKVHDLATAAKQAEQEMKSRAGRRDQGSQKAKPEKFDDIIDPTDAVDLPQPSSGYPFAVQASALHGLGVQESLGAAVLADRLPPPMSPGASTLDTEDRTWRKALLHAAVGHSLDNTPDVSISTSVDHSSPLASPAVANPVLPPPGSRERSPSVQVVGKRIVRKPLIEVSQESGPPSEPADHSTPRKSIQKSRLHAHSVAPTSAPTSRPSSFFPLRSETPSGPQTQLAPPPRRLIVNPLYSLSQTDLLSVDDLQSQGQPTPEFLTAESSRQSSPSPAVTDAQDAVRQLVMTPPPQSHLSMYSSLSVEPPRESGSDIRDTHSSLANSIAETQYYDYGHDDDESGAHRQSIITSAASDSRPSLSEYSQPSPTVSAFQDGITGDDYHSTVSSIHQNWRPSVDQHSSTTHASLASRYNTVSPPPRVSSSLARLPLIPRPRSPHHPMVLRSSQSLRSHSQPDPKIQESFLDLDETSTTPPAAPVVHILEPSPVTPPFPIAERRGNPATTPLTLTIPTGTVPVAIHSAPAPASPTSFFDDLQAQPNAMDDLDSSSDEEDDDEPEVEEDDGGRGPTNLYVNPRTRTISAVSAHTVRPNIYRLGNHSTPYVSRPLEGRAPLPFGVSDPKKPIGNVPPRAPYFNDKRPGKSALPAATFDFYQYSRSQDAAGDPGPSPRRRPATADHVQSWQANQRAVQTSQQLDGLLKRHMEAEKDVIKRIATSLRTSPPGRPDSAYSAVDAVAGPKA